MLLPCGDAFSKKPLPNKIQEEENIDPPLGSKVRPLVTGTGKSKIPDADGQFVNAPIFNWNDGELHFNSNWTNNANKQYGSASGFLPKSLLK